MLLLMIFTADQCIKNFLKYKVYNDDIELPSRLNTFDVKYIILAYLMSLPTGRVNNRLFRRKTQHLRDINNNRLIQPNYYRSMFAKGFFTPVDKWHFTLTDDGFKMVLAFELYAQEYYNEGGKSEYYLNGKY